MHALNNTFSDLCYQWWGGRIMLHHTHIHWTTHSLTYITVPMMDRFTCCMTALTHRDLYKCTQGGEVLIHHTWSMWPLSITVIKKSGWACCSSHTHTEPYTLWPIYWSPWWRGWACCMTHTHTDLYNCPHDGEVEHAVWQTHTHWPI